MFTGWKFTRRDGSTLPQVLLYATFVSYFAMPFVPAQTGLGILIGLCVATALAGAWNREWFYPLVVPVFIAFGLNSSTVRPQVGFPPPASIVIPYAILFVLAAGAILPWSRWWRQRHPEEKTATPEPRSTNGGAAC